MAKFISLQFRDGAAGGSQILQGSTVREMHRIQWLRPDWQSGWGLGFSVRRVRDLVRIGHAGGLPEHRTQIEIVPAQKLGVIVLTNANDGAPPRYIDQAFRLLGPAVTKALAAAETPRVADPAWQQYVGRYPWKFFEVQVQILNDELTIIAPEADDPWESRTIHKPVGPHAFRMVSPGFSAGPTGEVLTFELDGGGKVTRVRTPNSYWLPME